MKSIALSILCFFFGSVVIGQDILASAKLEARNVKEVRVRGSFVDVEVNKGDKVYFEGLITGSGDEGDYEFLTAIQSETLVIEVKSNKRYSWNSSRTRESYIRLTITDAVNLDIKNSSGDIEINYLEGSKSKIQASSGDVSVRGVNTDLDIETSSGDIEMKNVNGDIEVETTSGDQEYHEVKGDLDLVATSGDIRIEGFMGDVTLESTSGDVELKGGRGQLDVHTTSGEIDGYLVELTADSYFKASSGDIDFELKNNVEDMSFDLSATSGSLRVGSKRGEKKFMISKGGIKITGITSSGSQEYSN